MNHLDIHAVASAPGAQAPDHRPPCPVRRFTVPLSSTRRGARLARLLTVQQLIDWEMPFDAAAQIVAELASNAATHGRIADRDFRLTLTLRDMPGAVGGGAGGTLRIAVTDALGEVRPRVGPRDASDSESGRGLLLVTAYADRWGVEDGPGPCKTVWAELDLRGHGRHSCRATDSNIPISHTRPVRPTKTYRAPKG